MCFFVETDRGELNWSYVNANTYCQGQAPEGKIKVHGNEATGPSNTPRYPTVPFHLLPIVAHIKQDFFFSQLYKIMRVFIKCNNLSLLSCDRFIMIRCDTMFFEVPLLNNRVHFCYSLFTL